jgi:hypothetical protein
MSGVYIIIVGVGEYNANSDNGAGARGGL